MKLQKIDRFFKDKHGKWAVVQIPNVLLTIWLVLMVATWLLPDQHLKILQSCVLFTWAYLELTQGISHFRRSLGAVVMLVVVFGILQGL